MLDSGSEGRTIVASRNTRGTCRAGDKAAGTANGKSHWQVFLVC
jgi:hypothetical protein